MAAEGFDQLTKAAVKGDLDAMASLMKLGEACLESNNTADAARAFREAAIAYRIEAFRNKTHYAAEFHASQGLREILEQIYCRWFEVNRAPARKEWPEIGEISHARLSSIIDSPELSSNAGAHLQFLCQTLSGMGVEFHSPGGSERRRVFQLLRAIGGSKDSWAEKYLDDFRVRIALETIAECVVSINRRSGEFKS